MNVIKNLHKLEEFVEDKSLLDKLEEGARLHLRHSNIAFKIIKVFPREIHVRAEQGKHLAENYAAPDVLIKRTDELFRKYLPNFLIYTHPVPYVEAAPSIVTPKWLQDQMLTMGVRIKDIVADTGIDKTNISAWLNNKRPMSAIVKAMFYYYFKRLK